MKGIIRTLMWQFIIFAYLLGLVTGMYILELILKLKQ